MAFKIKDGFKIGTVDVFNENGKLLAPNIRGTATIRSAGAEETVSVYDGLAFTGRAGGTGSLTATFTPANLSANRTLTVPDQTGTLAITSDIKNGTLTFQVGNAGSTNTTITVGTGTGFSANTNTNTTYDIKVGPSLTNLATIMTGTSTGFLKKTGEDAYTLDTNTYLTSQSNDFGKVTVDDTDGVGEYTWSETGTATASALADTLKVVSGTGINVDIDTTNKAIRITSTALSSQSNDWGVAKIDNTDTEYTWVVTDGATATAEATADTLTFVAAKTGSTYGIQVKVDNDNDAIGIAHADTSTQVNVTNSAGSFIQSIEVDEFGHITSISSGSEVDTLQSVTDRGATTNNAITITNATDSTSKDTGALIVDGGVGIEKNLWVGGNINTGGSVTITGDLTIQGNYVIANTTESSYEDSVLELHRPATGGWLISNDGRDIGLKYDYFDNTPAGNYFAVVSGSGTGTVATLNISNDITYPVDSIVVISGVTPSGFNGTYRVTASSAGQFSYANTTSGSVTTTGALGKVYRLTELDISSASIAGTVLTVNYAAINGGAIAIPSGSTVTLTGIVAGASNYNNTYLVKAGATTTSFTVDVAANVGAVTSTAGAKIYFSHRFAFAGFANDTQAFEFYKVGSENSGVFNGIYGSIKTGTFWSSPSSTQTNADIAEGFALKVPGKTIYDIDTANSTTKTQASVVGLGQQTIGAVGSSVTYTNAASLYIADAPTQGTNVTITNKYAIQVAAGTSYFVGGIKTDSQLTSTVATGTAPFSVASTTVVTNLNADLLDGQQGSYYTTAGNLTGTLPSSVLGNSTLYVGTTAVALNRASDNQALTGILSVQFAGATSGTVTVTPVAVAGTTNITLPAKDGTVALLTNKLGDFAATTSAELAGVISDETGWNTGAKLVFSDSPVLTTPRAATIYGSSSASGTLTLSSTSDATKGTITIGDTGGNVKIIPNALPGSTAFLKISTDGTVSTDTNIYLTASTATLQVVTTAGNTTTNNIQLNGSSLVMAVDTDPTAGETWTSKIWRKALAPANITANTATGIDTWDKTLYRSANYIIQITQGTKYQISEVRLIHDGTAAYFTEYAVLETNSGTPIPIKYGYTIVSNTFTLVATVDNATTTPVSLLIERTLFAV